MRTDWPNYIAEDGRIHTTFNQTDHGYRTHQQHGAEPAEYSDADGTWHD